MLAALVHFTGPAEQAWLLPMIRLSRKLVETALDGLRDRSLLVEDDLAGTWLLPPLAGRFLRRARPEAVGSSGERLANWAYALVVENGGQQYARFPTLAAAWSQITAALPILLAGDNGRLQAAYDALFRFLDFSGRWDDRLAFSIAAEARAVLTRDHRRAGWPSGCAAWATSWPTTIPLPLTPPELTRKASPPTPANLAELALDREQWQDAEGLARDALLLAEKVGHKEPIASHCMRLAKALARQNRPSEGLHHALRAVATFTELRSLDLAEAQAVLAEYQR